MQRNTISIYHVRTSDQGSIDFGTDRAAAERYANAYGGTVETHRGCPSCYRNGHYTPCGCERD